MSTALRGIRVLDFADRSAALAGRILADLGAEVILVEPPEGNPIRRHAPFLDGEPGPERAYGHLYLNINKRSLVLDPRDTAGLEALVRSADVLIDTAAPGDPRFDHQALRTVNEDLIQCSVTPFGLDTPWRARKANDLVAGAAGGLIWVSGSPRGKPVQGAADPSCCMASLIAASSISIALYARETGNGGGVHIDVSLAEATLMAAMQTANPSQWAWHRRIPRRPGLSAALRCADGGHVGLLVRPDRMAGFLAWADRVGIDHGMTVDDWRWARLDAPREGNPVTATTLALAERLSRDEFVAGALEADIVCLPVLGLDELEGTEQYVVNEQFATIRHQDLGRDLGVPRSPVDAMADGVDLVPAPTLGEHQALLGRPAPRRRPAGRPPESDPASALRGIRVVDFSWVLAGPIGTRLLASYGAEVIRVESSTKPDSMRSQAGPDGKPHSDLGGLFNSVNAGKLSLTVDLTRPAGLDLVKDLIRTSDVVVNNFRPGAMARMGLGYDVLKSLREDIVLLNLPGAHRKGPWAARASMGNILMAASGFNLLTGFEGERPRGIGIAYPDFTSPHLLVSTILAALRQRRSTGHGQELHLTQLTGMLSLLGCEWMRFKAEGTVPARKANRDPNYCPHGVYRCRSSRYSEDEWIAIAASGDTQWRRLCALMGRVELGDDARLADHDGRLRHQDEIDAAIEAFTAHQDKWALADVLQEQGIAAAPVAHLADLFEHDAALFRHYQMVRQPAAPDIDIPIDREAGRWRGKRHDLRRAPGLGEHNEWVVRTLLGRSEEAFTQLLLDEVLV